MVAMGNGNIDLICYKVKRIQNLKETSFLII